MVCQVICKDCQGIIEAFNVSEDKITNDSLILEGKKYCDCRDIRTLFEDIKKIKNKALKSTTDKFIYRI